MDDKEIKKQVKALAKKYPLIKEVEIFYYGSGDSFDSYDVDWTPKKEEEKALISNVRGDDFEPVFWEMVERAGSNFNNEGSEGYVRFNLVDKIVTIDDYYRYSETNLNQSIEV